jgi:hypothetical protein
MGVDLENDYVSAQGKIKANRDYLQAKQDIAQIKKEQKNNLEKKKDSVSTSVDKIKEKKKKFQRNTKSQLDHLIELFQFNNGNGSSSSNYLKTKFIEIALKVSEQIFDLLIEESVTALGCSQQQAFTGNQTVYIKVQSVDLQGLLFVSPNEKVGTIAYEKSQPVIGTVPFSCNRSLYLLLQNVNTPFSSLFSSTYIGKSGQSLFDIEYVTVDNLGNQGDFFKVTLNSKFGNINRVGDFIVDYYSTIKLIDAANLFQQVMEQLVGSFSISVNSGTDTIEMNNKFILILQRILGLCFDEKREIDVSGTAKVGELDGVDQSFFEMGDIDLRYIDKVTSNIKLGVVEFEECDNVKLPVDVDSINNQLVLIQNSTSFEEQVSLINDLTNVITQNPNWQIQQPIKLAVDTGFLTNLPKALLAALLTPKVVLPIMIMSEAVGQNISNLINNLDDFGVKLQKFVINMMSRIGAIFIQELVELIKRDIKRLVSQILADIGTERVKKVYSIILKLIQIILLVLQIIDDFRKCKSVVDEILSLLSLLSGSASSSKIPAPLLAATELLDGFSNTRAFINIIDEYQKLGLPTGPLPDGSPNLMIISKLAEISGVQREQNENGKVQIFIKPLTILPGGGTTLPNGEVFGKSF